MKILKKLSAFVLSLLAFFCFVACGGGNGGDNSGGNGGGGNPPAQNYWITEMENVRNSIVGGYVAIDGKMDKYDQTGTVTVSSSYAISADETTAVFYISYLFRETNSKVRGEWTWSNETNSFSFTGRHITNNTVTINLTVSGLSIEECFNQNGFHVEEIALSKVTFETQPADATACVALVADALNECFTGFLNVYNG